MFASALYKKGPIMFPSFMPTPHSWVNPSPLWPELNQVLVEMFSNFQAPHMPPISCHQSSPQIRKNTALTSATRAPPLVSQHWYYSGITSACRHDCFMLVIRKRTLMHSNHRALRSLRSERSQFRGPCSRSTLLYSSSPTRFRASFEWMCKMEG